MIIEKKIKKLRKMFQGYNEVIILNSVEDEEVMIIGCDNEQTCAGILPYELFIYFSVKDIFSFALEQFNERGLYEKRI